MFSRIWTKPYTKSCSEQIERLKAALQDCDALIEENFSKYPGFAGVLQQYIFFYEREFSSKAVQTANV